MHRDPEWPKARVTQFIPLVGVAVAALLTAGVATAASPALVERSSSSNERITAGSVPPRVTEAVAAPVVDVSTTTVAALTTTSTPPPPTSAAPRVHVQQKGPTTTQPQPPPQPGGVQPPADAFLPRPPCRSIVPNPAWQATGEGLFLVPVDGSPVGPPVVPGSMKPQSVNLAPDGRTIAFTALLGEQTGHGDNTHLYLVDSDGRNLRRIAQDAYSPEQVVWSPDGRWLAFNDFDPIARTSDIYVTDAQGTGRRRVTSGGVGGTQLRWSPQSDRLAFVGNRAMGGAWVARLADGQLTKILDMAAVSVSWSPSGAQLAIRLEVVGAVVVSLAGAPPIMVAAEARSALWSPTADEIALELAGVVLARSDGTLLRNVGSGLVPNEWSPDGRWISAGSTEGLFVMAGAGDRCPVRLVAPGALRSSFAAWSPDSTLMAVVARDSNS